MQENMIAQVTSITFIYSILTERFAEIAVAQMLPMIRFPNAPPNAHIRTNNQI
jgi:hypothetical protein